ncbi:MAG: general secretion pathway protein GspK, partial [Candidatus Omnitrophica bacterium]|nr:general secretion pathway protein GspK [Candidatus Omnitrophota bacterium]
MKRSCYDQKASVLIMVLWALTLLAVFAVQIGMMTRDKISFLARAERQSILRNAAKGGVAKALAMIKNGHKTNNFVNILQTKAALYYNASSFRGLPFGQAEVSVVRSSISGQEGYGVTDEAGRLNLNFADRESIRKLLLVVGAAKEDNADKLSAAIYDWRVYGESEIQGFSSDDSYDNLQYPYPPKKANFETLDELRLVQGVTEKVFDSMIDYVTIYGTKEINVNTASWPVLMAVGFSEEQAKMIETMRRGVDGIEGTADDTFFQNSDTLVEGLGKALGLAPEDIDQLRVTIERIPLVVTSDIFRVQSVAQLVSRKENKSITCVFDA